MAVFCRPNRHAHLAVLFRFVLYSTVLLFYGIYLVAINSQITKQIQAVNEVYKLHSLPEFYKDPKPHISLAWALGDISSSLKKVAEEETKSSGFRGLSLRISQTKSTCPPTEAICKVLSEENMANTMFSRISLELRAPER
ncbi:hypothetical protein V6N12_068006 [Hibiscus sabdariffa]|uniref:U6 snRNA phosphodiesterase 1 n=1 Tax=Hibiscus sabdariffa TaxID=183260 RepID=A0ABR2FPE5_9ROSI